jgi:uncharacterized protein
MKQILNSFFNLKYLQRLILTVALMILTTLLVATPASATGVAQMPNLQPGERTWVIDQAEVLSRLNEGEISKELENLAAKTGNEVRIVTIRRLDYGETAESFAISFLKNGFPQKKHKLIKLYWRSILLVAVQQFARAIK